MPITHTHDTHDIHDTHTHTHTTNYFPLFKKITLKECVPEVFPGGNNQSYKINKLYMKMTY